jgi:hypothetical protein
MKLLEQIEIDALSEEECESQLKLLAKTYKLDKSIQEYLTPELWDQLDDIVNTLIWLEDRIQVLNDRRFNHESEADIVTDI